MCSVLSGSVGKAAREQKSEYRPELACESLFGNIRFLEDDLTEYSEKMKSQQKNDLAQKSRQIGRIISLIAILRPIVKFTNILH